MTVYYFNIHVCVYNNINSLVSINMSKISYRIVYNRKKQFNKEGKALLQVEAYAKGKRVYFSTNIYLSPFQWDDKKKIIKSHAVAESLNYYLKEFITNLEIRELELWKQGYDVSLDMLKNNIIINANNSFLEFVKEEIEKSTLKYSTKNNRKSTFKLLSKFKDEIRFDEITIQLICAFESYLYKRGYNINTIAKHMKHLRLFVNTAINKGLLETKDYPFRRYKIKTKESKHTFLLPEELQKLEDLERSIDDLNVRHVLDAFLFCCYTGLRYSDFINLSEQNIIMIDNNPWIVFHTIKTGTKIELPLHLLFDGKGLTMLDKYSNDLNTFFSLNSNSKTNKILAYICQLAGIDKHVSFHTARHTNATLLLYKGASITTVQKLLGHRNISTTQIYSEVLNRTIVRDLENCI